MRLVFLSTFSPLESKTGAEINTFDLAASMARRGHEVSLVHAYVQSDTRSTAEGVDVFGARTLGPPGARVLSANLNVLRLLGDLQRQAPIDILELRGAGLGLAFAKARGTRARIYHAMDLPRIEGVATLKAGELTKVPFFVGLETLNMLALSAADLTICDSDTVRADFGRVLRGGHANIVTVPPPVPDRWFEGKPDRCTSCQFVFIGANSRRDPLLFIRALASMRENGLPATGVMIREFSSKSRKLASALGVPVSFREGISEAEMISTLSESVAFVLPSHREAFCRTIIEAAARRVPTVASDLPTVRETVTPGVTGLIPTDWSPRTWALAMASLVANPELRERMGEAAFSRASQAFTMTKLSGLTEATYFQLLRQHQHR